MQGIYDFNIAEINEMLIDLAIEPLSLSGTFETMLFMRLDTIIMLLSIQNSNTNILIENTVNEYNLIPYITELKETLLTQQATTNIAISIQFALLGIVIAFMIFILVGVLWKK
jgi:hypothetical protein